MNVRVESWRRLSAKELMFWTVGLEKTLERPLDCKKIKPVNSKGNSPEYSLEDLMLKLKLQYFGHLVWRTDSLEKTLMLGKTEGRKRRGWQKMRWLDGITDSMDVSWGSPRRWWWTRKPGCFSPWGRKQLDMAEWLNNASDKLSWVPWKAQAIEQ